MASEERSESYLEIHTVKALQENKPKTIEHMRAAS